MSDEIHFAPDIQGTIAATRAKHFEWVNILGELIDNSFDAGATRVDITIAGRELTIEDDGTGCDDMGRMLTMGRHSKKSTTKLGRYGVGLKDAAWWVGGATRIETQHAGKQHSIRLDWDRLAGWSAPVPLVTDSDGKRGTRIRFESLSRERRFPDGKRLESMLADLAFTYSPALKNNKQIVFRRTGKENLLLQSYELPDIADKVEKTITVDGRTARICVGVVPEGIDNPRPGITYTHAFRVIMHNALGCNGYGCARIAGRVSLDEGWTLARNKDDVTAYKDELGDAVFAAIRHVVEKASSQALTLKSSSLAESLTSAFRGIVGGSEDNAKAKRDSARNKTGRSDPTGTGGKHGRARKSQAGTRFREMKPGRFRVDFRPCREGVVGEVDLDGRVISLASNHPWVNEAKVANDQRTLLAVAVMLFASRDVDNPTPLLSVCRDGSVSRDVAEVAGHLFLEMHNAESSTAALKVVA
jgi:hypothetical protein